MKTKLEALQLQLQVPMIDMDLYTFDGVAYSVHIYWIVEQNFDFLNVLV